MASIKAMRALARAVAMAVDWLAERREMDESVSRPTAMMVSRIIRLRVTTKAKPLGFASGDNFFRELDFTGLDFVLPLTRLDSA